jgi:hypothetical protein
MRLRQLGRKPGYCSKIRNLAEEGADKVSLNKRSSGIGFDWLVFYKLGEEESRGAKSR